jgi:hypothetical protein
MLQLACFIVSELEESGTFAGGRRIGLLFPLPLLLLTDAEGCGLEDRLLLFVMAYAVKAITAAIPTPMEMRTGFFPTMQRDHFLPYRMAGIIFYVKPNASQLATSGLAIASTRRLL